MALADVPASALHVERGVCYALFAYDAGLGIDLDQAERRVTAATERAGIRPRHRAPKYFEYRPAPLRVRLGMEPIQIGTYRSADFVDAVLYDFGAVSVAYHIGLAGPFADLVPLSENLYDNESLLAHSRRYVEQLVEMIGPALTRPGIADAVEPYFIFELAAVSPPAPPAVFWTSYAEDVARILRSERGALSSEEVDDAIAYRISFGPGDVAIVDWDATLLAGEDVEDVRAVLEFANVELLEMRHLDQQLDDALDESYERLSRRGARLGFGPSARADLRRVAQLQVDNALLFEGVNNALKLLGDQYLARVYRLASARFHLTEWDASILRKLQTLDSIYQKLADQASNRRIELLEWIIIGLIAAELALPVLMRLGGG
jgi:hypothetical protein